MAKAHCSKTFTIDGSRVTLAAGVKTGRPVVVLGVRLATSYTSSDPLDFITIDYPMRSTDSAEAFVSGADAAVARRGKSDVLEKFGDVIEKVTHAFNSDRAALAPRRINPFEANK